MGLVSVASFVVAYIFIRGNGQEIHQQDFIVLSLNLHEKIALEKLSNSGQEAFQDYLKYLEENLSLVVFVYKEKKIIYKSSLTSLATTETEKLHQFINDKENLHIHFAGDRLLIVKKTFNINGENFLFSWNVNISRPRFPEIHRVYQVLRILVVLAVVGLVCYILSRYLTTPIIKLSLATRQLANGDWQARVGKSVGNRKDELSELARDFDNMAEKICLLISSQKRLISDVSHELRSPLARLNVALSLARKRAGEKALSSLDRIELESERLNALISQILTLTELESSKSLNLAPVNLTKLVKSIAEDASFEAQNKNSSVTYKLDEISVLADKNLIYSAVDNILRNAICYTKEDSIVQVFLSCQTLLNRDWAVIEVQDQGDGVPESDLIEIFRPFYRVEYARERDRGGSGLGLAIVAQTVKLHKGKIEAKNLIPNGLSVTIYLPINAKEIN